METPKELYKIWQVRWLSFAGKPWKHLNIYVNPSSKIQEMVMRSGAMIGSVGAITPDEIEDAFNAAVIRGQINRDRSYIL